MQEIHLAKRTIDLKTTLAYERLTDKIWGAIGIDEGEHLLIRRPFRWLLDGHVVPNAYEMFDVDVPLELLGMEIVESYGDHIHVVRKKHVVSEVGYAKVGKMVDEIRSLHYEKG